MIFKNILSKLYLKVYIGLIVSKSEIAVCAQVLRGNKIVRQESKRFNIQMVEKNLNAFIAKYTKESPFAYVSFLDYSGAQGAFKSCDQEMLSQFTNHENTLQICYGKWSSYTTKEAIERIQAEYRELGVDFIFSPFAVLASFFADKITQEQPSLMVLFQEDSAAIAVFYEGCLQFASFINMQILQEENFTTLDDDTDIFETPQEQEDTINLEDIDLDENFGDFGDLQELEESDSIEDMEDFTQEEPSKNSIESVEEKSKNEILEFSQDYKRFLIVQNALKDFYVDERYDGRFVETVYAAAFCPIGTEFRQYIEEELFLKVYVRQIDLCEELITLAKGETP
jgi:hypothetical protein